MSPSEGGASRPNRLIHASSPYLRQHAGNPVDWYPWGEEAFRRARELDRPIFLSVGYSSCHWCHVMAHESFEDPEIARLLNDHFVSIKVDREERPDVDAVYMNAVQLLGRQGGWPMSVFLDQELRPFWAGTYFPPRGRYGMVGFADVLQAIAKAWSERRDDVRQTAEQVVSHLEADPGFRGEDLPGEEDLRAAADAARRSFDSRHGGFGGAPKFPRSVEIDLLLRLGWRWGEGELLEMSETTLLRMAEGGIRDHVGGGFHRYSTDERWLVPHFEKMLYDNALLARTYLTAWQATGRDLWRDVATDTLEWLLREMRSDEGGFYSATDADSDGKEGAFFVWRPRELEEVLGPEDARLVALHWGVTEQGNFEEGASILHVAKPLEDAAREAGIDPSGAPGRLQAARERLREARARRPAPFRDEKVLSGWNALAISALARAAQLSGGERWLEAATSCADLILRRMTTEEGRLLRVRMEGRSEVPAFLDDHAWLADALLDVWEATFDPRWLREARRLADFVLREFADPQGGFFFTAGDQERLVVRRGELFDGATPSGSGVAAQALLRLARLTGESSYREAAEGHLRSVRGGLGRVPMAFGSTLIATDMLRNPSFEVAVVGAFDDDRTRALLETARREFVPGRVLAAAEPGRAGELAGEVPLLEGKPGADGIPRAWVCRDFACRAPVDDPGSLRAALRVAPAAEG